MVKGMVLKGMAALDDHPGQVRPARHIFSDNKKCGLGLMLGKNIQNRGSLVGIWPIVDGEPHLIPGSQKSTAHRAQPAAIPPKRWKKNWKAGKQKIKYEGTMQSMAP